MLLTELDLKSPLRQPGEISFLILLFLTGQLFLSFCPLSYWYVKVDGSFKIRKEAELRKHKQCYLYSHKIILSWLRKRQFLLYFEGFFRLLTVFPPERLGVRYIVTATPFT